MSASSAARGCCFTPVTAAGPNRYVINANSTQRMLNAYNARLRQYVIAKGYLEKLEFSTISGARIIDEFGYRECPRGG